MLDDAAARSDAIAATRARLAALDDVLARGMTIVRGRPELTATAFVKVSRGIRLTVALASRLEAELLALREGRPLPGWDDGAEPKRDETPAKADGDADPEDSREARLLASAAQTLDQKALMEREVLALREGRGPSECLHDRETCPIDPHAPPQEIVERLCAIGGFPPPPPSPEWGRWPAKPDGGGDGPTPSPSDSRPTPPVSRYARSTLPIEGREAKSRTPPLPPQAGGKRPVGRRARRRAARMNPPPPIHDSG